jgi:hypothetical protein
MLIFAQHFPKRLMTKFDFNDEYRRSDEYRSLYSMIKTMNPSLPHSLVEIAIMMNQAEPALYKKAKRDKNQEKLLNPKINFEPYELGGGIEVSDTNISNNVIEQTCSASA